MFETFEARRARKSKQYLVVILRLIKFTKALLKNFGLQAIISDHSLKWDEGKLASAIKWDLGPDPLKVTLCLLTLPCVVAYEQTESKYNDIIDGMDDPPTHTSFLIDPASLRLRKKDRKLFQRAMQILSLKPFVHPSRMQHRLSARLKKPTRVDQETFNRPDCDSKRIAAAQATLKTRKFSKWKVFLVTSIAELSLTFHLP